MQETPASEVVNEKVRFVTETPDLYCSDEAQAYVQRELDRPSKAWIREVVGSTRETEFVKLRTPEFVLLPDLNNPRRPQQRPFPPWSRATAAPFQQSRRSFQRPPSPAHPAPRRFNWLAIVADPGLRSVRDLRGEHLPMLERLHRQCVEAIQGEHKVGEEDIMVFANYPPSVYRLHFHFCAPFFQPSAFDAFRMHPLSAIINNLRLLSGYYALSTFQIPVHSSSDLYRALACASDYGAGDAPSQFHERIANIVLITKKLCERLSPMNQYVLVLRSIEHVERVMLLEKHGGLPCQLPQETLLIDVAVVMLISKFYFGDGLFKWKDALPFVGNRTRVRGFRPIHMDLLMWDLFRAVDFRLKPLAVYEGWHDPIATPLLCVGDPSLGLHVDVVERFEMWQYEQTAPDPTDPRRQFKPRSEMRVDTALGWPLSVSTSTEVAILNHWLVYTNVERLYMSTHRLDTQLLLRTEPDMAGEPLADFHWSMAQMCRKSVLMTQATFDEAVFHHARPPRLLPVGDMLEIGEKRPSEPACRLMDPFVPTMTASLERGIAAYFDKKSQEVRALLAKRPAALDATHRRSLRDAIGGMKDMQIVAKHWQIESHPSWGANLAEFKEKMSNTRLELNANAQPFEPEASKRRRAEYVYTTPHARAHPWAK